MAHTGKNKTAMWRRLAKKGEGGQRNGRKIKAMMTGMQKAWAHPILIWLMKRGGIATPVFDKMMQERQNSVSDKEVAAIVDDAITSIQDIVAIPKGDNLATA